MVIMKFHEKDDILSLKFLPRVTGKPHVEATVPGGYTDLGSYVRLIAPKVGFDDIVKIIRMERNIDKMGDLTTFEAEIVDG